MVNKMKQLYNLEEIQDISFKAYNKAINKLMHSLGGMELTVIRYCKQAGYLVDIDGVVYSPIL